MAVLAIGVLIRVNGSAYGRLGVWWPPAGEHSVVPGFEPWG